MIDNKAAEKQLKEFITALKPRMKSIEIPGAKYGFQIYLNRSDVAASLIL